MDHSSDPSAPDRASEPSVPALNQPVSTSNHHVIPSFQIPAQLHNIVTAPTLQGFLATLSSDPQAQQRTFHPAVAPNAANASSDGLGAHMQNHDLEAGPAINRQNRPLPVPIRQPAAPSAAQAAQGAPDAALLGDAQQAQVQAQAAPAANQQRLSPNETLLRDALQGLFSYIFYLLPFLVICFFLLIYLHFYGTILYVWNITNFLSLNAQVKTQAARKEHRAVSSLVYACGSAAVHIAMTYFFFSNSDYLWKALIFAPPPQGLTFLESVWVILTNELIVKFFGIILKSIAIIAVGHLPPYKSRGRLYSLIEMLLKVYRTLLPIGVWVQYFRFVSDDYVAPLGFLAMYALSKSLRTWQRMRHFLPVLAATLRSGGLSKSPFGRYATPEMIRDAHTDSCSICQDSFNTPILLDCGHIYCEECISAWFEREATCPLCRATIPSAGIPSFSDAGTSMEIDIF